MLHDLRSLAPTVLTALFLVSPTTAQEAMIDTVPGNDGPSVSPSRSWTTAWRLELSRGASATPVWVDSMLLVASLDRNVHLVRLAPEPVVEWKENYKGGFQAPPVVTEERFYFAETRRGERLLAVDRHTREIDWTVDAGDAEATPLLVEDRIYTVSSIGLVKAWDLRGGEVWETELETRIVADPILVGRRLVLATSDGTLHALDPESGEVLTTVDPEAGPIWGDPILHTARDGATRAIYTSLEGHVIEIDEDLEVVQRRTFPSAFYAGAGTGRDGRLYLSGHDGTIWAYEWDSSEIVWTAEVGSALRMAPVAGDDLVAVGDLRGTLHLLDEANGTTLWSERLDDAMTAAPVIGGTRVYAITERGTLYAFASEERDE